jgi:hypothetical protein
MKKFKIEVLVSLFLCVPYSETVYGWTTYHVLEADSLEEAREMLLKDDYLYYYDQETDHSDHYTQFWDDAEWEELVREDGRVL